MTSFLAIVLLVPTELVLRDNGSMYDYTGTGPPIPVLGVPVVNGVSLIKRLVESIDHPVRRLVFVHNQDEGQPNESVGHAIRELKRNPPKLVGRVVVHTYPANLGVSAAWNTIILKHSAPWWLVANADVAFVKGTLKFIAKRITTALQTNATTCNWLFRGYSLYAMTPRTVSRVGTFDENFWPAYSEDCDYQKRLVESNCPTDRVAVPLLHAGSSTHNALPNSKLFKIVNTGGAAFNNQDYLRRKWGDDFTCGRMERTGLPVSLSWRIDEKRRLERGGPKMCVACDKASWVVH